MPYRKITKQNLLVGKTTFCFEKQIVATVAALCFRKVTERTRK